MALSVGEQRILDGISRQVAAEDPEFHRRLAAFGAGDGSPLGFPGRWIVLPVAMAIMVLVAMVALFVAVGTTRTAPDTAHVSHSRTAAHR